MRTRMRVWPLGVAFSILPGLLLVTLPGPVRAVEPETVEEVLKRLEANLGAVRTVQTRFTQEKALSIFKRKKK